MILAKAIRKKLVARKPCEGTCGGGAISEAIDIITPAGIFKMPGEINLDEMSGDILRVTLEVPQYVDTIVGKLKAKWIGLTTEDYIDQVGLADAQDIDTPFGKISAIYIALFEDGINEIEVSSSQLLISSKGIYKITKRVEFDEYGEIDKIE